MNVLQVLINNSQLKECLLEGDGNKVDFRIYQRPVELSTKEDLLAREAE